MEAFMTDLVEPFAVRESDPSKSSPDSLVWLSVATSPSQCATGSVQLPRLPWCSAVERPRAHLAARSGKRFVALKARELGEMRGGGAQ